MRESRMKRMRIALGGALLAACLFLMSGMAFALSGSTIVFRTVTAPSEGCTLVAVDGSYVADARAVLDRINEIRYEACTQGIADPRNSSRALTTADYVPIRWSVGLDYIARVRAAEASRRISHTRPNGDSPFSVKAPNGQTSWGEVLAWNHSSDILTGINQWYGEKSSWVNRDGGVTGHYTAMINPSNTYVGVSCFLSKGGIYYNTTAGEFATGSGYDETAMAPVPDCRAIIEIQASALSGAALVLEEENRKSSVSLDKGDSLTYFLGMTAVLEGRSAPVADAGNVHWSSSNSAVASVDGFGHVVITGPGTAVITAVSDSGRSAQVSLTAAHQPSDWTVAEQASADRNGKRVRKCSICGEIVEEAVIPQIGQILMETAEYTYDGSLKRPAVTVLDVNGNAVSSSFYSLQYRDNKDVGDASVVISFKKEYTGSAERGFVILPMKVQGLKAAGGKKRMTVSWNFLTGQVSGYEIQYSLKKSFSKARTVRVKNTNTASKVIRNLKPGKKYYVRIRSYYKKNGKKYTSLWSGTARAKIRKKDI